MVENNNALDEVIDSILDNASAFSTVKALDPETVRIEFASDTGEELVWDDIYKQLVNYIKYAAKNVFLQYRPDIYTPEDLFQEGQLLLFHCYTLYKNKSMEQFCAIFKSSLWRKLHDIGDNHRPVITIDIEEAYDIGYTDKVIDSINHELMMKEVADILEQYPLALTIFKEFVNPSTRTTWEAQMEVARKQTLKNQNIDVNVPKSAIIRPVHIERALELPHNEFKKLFRAVQATVAYVYRDEGDIDSVYDLLDKCA